MAYYYYMYLANRSPTRSRPTIKSEQKDTTKAKALDVDRLLIKFSCRQIVKSVLLESLELYILRTNALILCASAHAG